MILFWLMIIGGLGLAFVGLKKGFLPMWAATFNIMVAVYLAVMLLPVYAEYIPNSGTVGFFYSCAACMLLVAVLTFAVLQPIASAWFSGGYAIAFPKILNMIAAPILGFAAGAIATAFLIFVLALMPFSAYPCVKGALDEPNLSPAVKGAVTASCNVIGAASVQIYPRKAVDIIEEFAARRARFLAAQDAPTAPSN